MKVKLHTLTVAVIISVLGSISIQFVSCSNSPSPQLGLEEGSEWGMKLKEKLAKDYEVVYYITERVIDSNRDGFHAGFIQGFGVGGERIIDILFTAAASDEFNEGKLAGERLREAKITDVLIRDYIVSNRIKSEAKRTGWRCGFIIGYKSDEHSYEEGEAIYRSIESSIL